MTIAGTDLIKSFAGKRVLDAVNIDVTGGEIHALLGANGSGKSTLVKILTGVYQPDGGEIAIAGRKFDAIASPGQAGKLGIAVVHQEVPLIDTATVAECIALFRGYPTSGWRIRWRALRREVEEMLGRFDAQIDPDRLAGTLSPAERALVALIVALDRVDEAGLNLLVLDEVTASLPSDEAEPYLNHVAALAARGVSVLMVTHRLGELHGRADRMTILRDGRAVYSGAAGDLDDEAIVGHMVGGDRSSHAVAVAPAAAPCAEGGVILKVDGLAVDRLSDLNLELRAGEILGVAGLAESGIAELPQVLSGAAPHRAGLISVNGHVLPRRGNPRASIRAGLAVLPADRLRSGGIASLPVADNIALPDVDRYFLRPGRERDMVADVIRRFDVRPPIAATLFGRLSGGNQQKALLGKWLHLKPSVLVLDDPTSGVDPGAREKIFETLRHVAADGVGIVFFSTEPEQLAALCSRVLVLRNGAVATELSGADLKHETISQWCYA
ncbi:MAG TPA: sugar ABC transporter ATP-binding protein [Bauldia sp.]|nr:sugar ABC transporter ATP-binding protein [Bauldia sp.]